MISVILYGRNDDYGYNLHKRAALSLNCIAHVLCDGDDEIIFVDYNTPDDFPTFPEAIRDTLTLKAQSMLRILRVRPSIHRRYDRVTHLPALEPIARNVGIRRSNPDNRWVLSTNTDMIFLPRGSQSLSAIVGELESGYYHLPRFDVPESLWETFDRINPKNVINEVEELGETAHLNEIVLGADHLLYDAPGDFQLVERQELFAIHGFCEAMLLGWHVDANLAKRLYLRHGRVGDLADCLRAYHCEHTRSFSNMHYLGKENDIAEFVDHIEQAAIPEQADTWGLPAEHIEELSLACCPSAVYLRGLGEVITEEQLCRTDVLYTPETFNLINYDPRHVLPYLGDLFVNLPRQCSVAWAGGGGETLRLFGEIWEQLGFSGRILLAEEAALACKHNNNQIQSQWYRLVNNVDVFVFDFADLACEGGITGLSGDLKRRAAALLSLFFSLVSVERLRPEGDRRRVVLVNAINNDFEKLAHEFLRTVRMPISSRIRHGFVARQPEPVSNWLARQFIGVAGQREEERVRFQRGRAGHVVYGPYLILGPGDYRATIGIELRDGLSETDFATAPLVVEMASGEHFLAQRAITRDALTELRHSFDVTVTPQIANSGNSFRTELRVWTSGELGGFITSVELQMLADHAHPIEEYTGT